MKRIAPAILLLFFTGVPLRAQSGIQNLAGKAAFENAIARNEKAVIIFAADWCEYCKAFLPKVEEITTRYPTVTFFKIGYDDNVPLFEAEGIEMTPTVKLYKNGVKKDEMVIIEVKPLFQKLQDF